MHAIELNNVWARYGDKNVLENIHLHVPPGELLTVVGPNGGGKSTLLRIMLGLKEPFTGTVSIFGHSPKMARRQNIIGYLPQISSYDHMFPLSVYDVVAMARFSQKRWLERLTSTDKAAITKALQKTDMLTLAQDPFGNLSGGQKQRVLIARALAMNPKILLLDEPSTGLDIVAQESFYQLLVQLRDENQLTIVLVSHDIGSVSAFVDKVACLKRRMHFHGKASECIPSEALKEVFGSNVQFLLHDKHCETCQQHQNRKE